MRDRQTGDSHARRTRRITICCTQVALVAAIGVHVHSRDWVNIVVRRQTRFFHFIHMRPLRTGLALLVLSIVSLLGCTKKESVATSSKEPRPELSEAEMRSDIEQYHDTIV